MKRTGYADLPLHYGRVPQWLAQRMSMLGGAIIESIVYEYGKAEVLKRLSDPFWFQSFGAVLGMDWHSSGITTSVMGALKKALNNKFHELGIYVCGGRGKHSRRTPEELLEIADKTGLDGENLVYCSRLSAKVDNTALQDGFNIYLHSFVLTDDGEWAVVQQGLNNQNGFARRYHWHSPEVTSFVDKPHSFIFGENQGLILNLTDHNAENTRTGIVDVTHEHPDKLLSDIKKLSMPGHHHVTAHNVNLKRLGSVLAVAYEQQFRDFESLLLLQGVGPRTIQSLTLVSEIIYGTPSRFKDPARFSFAHGGKDGHPAPVPLQIYDESIDILRTSLNKAKVGTSDKQNAIKKLSEIARVVEQNNDPMAHFNNVISKERREVRQYGGRTVFDKPGKRATTLNKQKDVQLTLFN